MDAFEAFRLGKGNEKAENDVVRRRRRLAARRGRCARAPRRASGFPPARTPRPAAAPSSRATAPRRSRRRGVGEEPPARRGPRRSRRLANPSSPRVSVSPPAASARVPEPVRDRPGPFRSPPPGPLPGRPTGAGCRRRAAAGVPPMTPRARRGEEHAAGQGLRDAEPAGSAGRRAARGRRRAGRRRRRRRRRRREGSRGRARRFAERNAEGTNDDARGYREEAENAPGRVEARAEGAPARRKRAPKPPSSSRAAQTRVEADASEAHASLSAEDVLEAPRGVESATCASDDFEDAFEKAFDATAEFVVREFEPAEKRAAAACARPPPRISSPGFRRRRIAPSC